MRKWALFWFPAGSFGGPGLFFAPVSYELLFGVGAVWCPWCGIRGLYSFSLLGSGAFGSQTGERLLETGTVACLFKKQGSVWVPVFNMQDISLLDVLYMNVLF